MSDIKNENNTKNNLGPDFGTYRQASIEEDEVIECDARNEQSNEFDSNDEICVSKYEKFRSKSAKNSTQANTKHLNQNSPRFLNFNSVNNGSRLGNRLKISKPNKPDQSVNTPYPPDLLSYFEDTSEQRPALNLPNYICSDDTLLTGYRPNIDLNANELSRQIKLANMQQLNPSRKQNFEPIKPCYVPSNLNGKLDEKLYEIISGTNGFYNNQNSKIMALKNVYQNNTALNGILILKCILNEVKSTAISIKYGLELLNQLDFCTESTFSKAFGQILSENQNVDLGPMSFINTDNKRKKFCQFLANIYIVSCQSDKYKCLRQVPNLCAQLLSEWILIYKDRDISNLTYIENLKSIYYFLAVCFDQFKMYDQALFIKIYEKAKSYNLDNTLIKEIVTASFNIVDLYAQEYIKNYLTGKKSNHVSQDQNSVSNDDVFSSQPPTITYINKTGFNFRKQSNFLESFLVNDSDFPLLI